MQTLPLHLFRAQLAQTLDRVIQGERVQVTRRGIAVIELRPVNLVKREIAPMWKRALKPHPFSRIADKVSINPVIAERDEHAY